MKLYNEDCMKQMQEMIDDGIQVDSVVTDPPYGIHFMGKDWDKFKGTKVTKSQVVTNLGAGMRMTTYEENMDFQKWCNEWATLCLKLLKPGGYILAFSSARTYHHLACGIESAGFEVRDQLMWLYGSGFPKSMNIGMQIDKKLGNKRIDLGTNPNQRLNTPEHDIYEAGIRGKKARITKGDSEWEGWGTALKPAHEPVVLARKPVEGTVAENVLKHGTGGINIDGCRIGTEERTYDIKGGENLNKLSREGKGDSEDAKGCGAYGIGAKQKSIGKTTVEGRFPANVMHDGSEEVLEGFPETSKSTGGGGVKTTSKLVYGDYKGKEYDKVIGFGDEGSAARFFYCPKVSKNERGEENIHPTVKPIELMKYLCRLVTPKGGIVLDPFMGSGSTGMATKDEGFDFVGIEREKEYFEIAEARINASSPLLDFFE